MNIIRNCVFCLVAGVSMLLSVSCGTEESNPLPSNSKPTPMTVELISITTSSAVFQWTKSIDPDGGSIDYYVEVSLGSNEVLFGPSKELQFTLTDLEPGLIYSMFVIAKDNEGDEGYSNVLEFSAAEIQPPVPFKVTVDAVDHESATLSWTASSNADGDPISYEIFLNPGDDQIGKGWTEQTTLTITQLTANTTYNGIVRAYAWVGNYGKHHDEPFTITTTDDPHKMIMNLTAVEYGFQYATLIFDASSTASMVDATYDLYLNGEEYHQNFAMDVQPDVEMLVQGLESETEYNWTIVAKRDAQTYISDPLIFTTLVTPHNDFEIEAEESSDELTITWERFNNETPDDFEAVVYIGNTPIPANDFFVSSSVIEEENKLQLTILSDMISSGNHEVSLKLLWGFNQYTNESVKVNVDF